MGTTVKKIVELVGEPSYTSGAHIWKGAAAILKKNAIEIHIQACSTDTCNGKVSNWKSVKNKERLPKFVVPVHPYNKDTPNKNKADENDPKIKYFNPASKEKEEFFLDAAKIYKHKLWTSIAKYNDIKS